MLGEQRNVECDPDQTNMNEADVGHLANVLSSYLFWYASLNRALPAFEFESGPKHQHSY